MLQNLDIGVDLRADAMKLGHSIAIIRAVLNPYFAYGEFGQE
jgi:hypothetical protein